MLVMVLVYTDNPTIFLVCVCARKVVDPRPRNSTRAKHFCFDLYLNTDGTSVTDADSQEGGAGAATADRGVDAAKHALLQRRCDDLTRTVKAMGEENEALKGRQ